MSPFLLPACAALALLSAALVALMARVGVLDRPGHRSSHTVPTPKGGGVGVVAAFLLGMALLGRGSDPAAAGVTLAAAGIALVSFLDDVLGWPFSAKLAAQLAAAGLAVASGLWLHDLRVPVLGSVPLGWLGVPMTLVWVVAATNAMNFIDGLNGLASGVALIAALALAGIAAGEGAPFVVLAALLLAAGLAGFLPFNYPRARIFLGDVGSQFCGFVLAVLGVAAGRFARVELSLLLVPMLLSGVLFDTGFTLLRRLLAGERVTEAHRGHLYQVAHRSGMPAWAVTLVEWAMAAWGAGCCLLFLRTPEALKPLVPLLVLPPQLAWLAWVAARARRRGLGRW